MAKDNDRGDNRDNERMGRGVHEGLNAGQSRNAHDSGSRGASGGSSGGASGAQADGNDQGRGGYGNDTGFAGGSRASTDEHASDAGDRSPTDESRGMKAAPGSSGARTEDTSRSDGVGNQASSGMDERSSSAEPR